MPFDGSLSERLPTPDEVEKAKQASRVLAKATKSKEALAFRLRGDDTFVELPRAVSDLVLNLLMLISKGEAVTLVPVGAELTTQEAADLLNVSRPFLIKLLEAGEIEHHQVGTHRRIKAQDVFAYKRRRDAARKDTLRELARLGQEIDG